MSILNIFKTKKEELIEKAKKLKSEYDHHQRNKKKEWISLKEIELKEFEEKLNDRKEIIRQKEEKLSHKFFLRFIMVAGVFSMLGVFVWVGTIDIPRHDIKPQTSSVDKTLTKKMEKKREYTREYNTPFNLENEIVKIESNCRNNTLNQREYEKCMYRGGQALGRKMR